MIREILPSELWEKIEPVIAEMDPRLRTGRPRVPDRAVLRGILFVLKTGIQWEYLPQEMGCGSGMTCWSALHNPKDPYLTRIYGNLSCMPYTRKAGMNARNLVYE